MKPMNITDTPIGLCSLKGEVGHTVAASLGPVIEKGLQSIETDIINIGIGACTAKKSI
jgi:hypothetical protein